MKQAVWKGVVLAESDQTIIVEGNTYFPLESVRREYLRASDTHTVCPWKGVASYYTIQIDDQVNHDGAWYYPEPNTIADRIRGYVAFWRGVEIKDG